MAHPARWCRYSEPGTGRGRCGDGGYLQRTERLERLPALTGSDLGRLRRSPPPGVPAVEGSSAAPWSSFTEAKLSIVGTHFNFPKTDKSQGCRSDL